SYSANPDLHAFPTRRSSDLFGLAGLSKPIWLSLICRKVMPAGSAACADPTSPIERGTPPEIVQSTPVPAQVMHSSTRRRLTPSSDRKSTRLNSSHVKISYAV